MVAKLYVTLYLKYSRVLSEIDIRKQEMRRMRFVKRCVCVVMMFVFSSGFIMKAQMVLGTQGMLNSPTADMYPVGTFVGGVTFVPKEMEFVAGDYNTGIYYLDFTPFSWMELTFRETLLKMQKVKHGEIHTGYYNQDRSTTLRLRPITERDSIWWRPSLLLGVNDIYSDHGTSRYTAVYLVATKHVLMSGFGKVGISVGYAHKFDDGVVYDGVFWGVEYYPQGVKNLRFMADWDTSGVNVGAHLQLFRHLNLIAYTREFKSVGAGISYQYTIKY